MTALEFNSKIEALHATLLGFTWKFTRDTEEARDLVQDTLLKAISNRDKFISNTNLKGWLYTIMRNTFINNYRRRSRSKATADLTENQYYLNQEDDYTFHCPQEALEYSDIEAVIESIDAKYNVPLNMHIEGYKYDEISEELDIPLGTVKARIHKARQEVKKRIAA